MVLSLIFFAHWVGDFLFQTTPMAIHKSHSIKWLSIHVLVYTGVIALASIIIMDPNTFWRYTLLNGAIHWVVDFFTSKIVSRFKDQPRPFFILIGLDQLIHILSLLWTYYLFS